MNTLSTFKKMAQPLLTRLETLTRTDIRYLLKGSGWLGMNEMSQNLLAFLLSIAFANLVSKEVFGIYRTYLSLETFVTAFMLGGMGVALSRAVAQGNGGTLLRAIRTTLRWDGLIGGISFCFGIYFLAMEHSVGKGLALILIGVVAPLIETYKLHAWYLQGKKRFREGALFGVAQEGGPIAMVLLALFFVHNALLLMAVFFVSQTLIVLALYEYTHRHFFTHEPEDAGAIRYGFQLSALNILNVISTQIDRLVLFALLGPVAVAVYTFAVAIPDRLKSLCRIIGSLALPKFSTRSYEEIQETLLYRLTVMAIVVMVIGALYAVCAPFIFQIIFPRYEEAVHLSQLASLMMIGSLISVPAAALNAHRKMHQQTVLGIISPLFEITITIVMGLTWGLVGVLCAQILSYVITLVLYLLTLRYW